MCSILDSCQSQSPCSLRHVFMAAHLLGLWVRILVGYGCLSFVGVVCGLAEVSATGWSLIQRNPTKFGVSECDHEASTMKRPWPTRGCHAMGKKTLGTSSPCRAAVLWIPFCNLNMVNHQKGALNSHSQSIVKNCGFWCTRGTRDCRCSCCWYVVEPLECGRIHFLYDELYTHAVPRSSTTMTYKFHQPFLTCVPCTVNIPSPSSLANFWAGLNSPVFRVNSIFFFLLLPVHISYIL